MKPGLLSLAQRSIQCPSLTGDENEVAQIFVAATAKGPEKIGEPVSYSYWDFGTDLAMVCGRHGVAAIGYSPMQEYYCHRPVDMCRIDFMERALLGNIAVFTELTQLKKGAFSL